MRIVGGRWRGRALHAPGDVKGIRPTADRVREAIFNILAASGFGMAGARVLDLFAGTGALGLEAMSRGAAHGAFVERSAAAAGLLQRNLALFEGIDAVAIRADATRLPPCPVAAFDLAFCDPPYGTGQGAASLASALARGWLAPGATIVLEEGAEVPLPPGFAPHDRRRYGDTVVTFAEVP